MEHIIFFCKFVAAAVITVSFAAALCVWGWVLLDSLYYICRRQRLKVYHWLSVSFFLVVFLTGTCALLFSW